MILPVYCIQQQQPQVILITCGCCCIPCIRGLVARLIDKALTRTMYQQLQNRVDDDYDRMNDHAHDTYDDAYV